MNFVPECWGGAMTTSCSATISLRFPIRLGSSSAIGRHSGDWTAWCIACASSNQSSEIPSIAPMWLIGLGEDTT